MFSYRLKQLREDLGMTQNELAKLLNLSQSTIAYYEKGRKMPTLENAISIAKIFDTSLDYLVGLSNYQNTQSIKENEKHHHSTLLLNDIFNLRPDSLKEVESFIPFLKFRDKHANNS